MCKTFRQRRLIAACLLALACAAHAAPARRAQEMSRHPPTETATDEQLVERLAAKDYATADAAVDEVMRRGERMIPLLLKLRGDRRYFSGFLTRNPDSSTSIPVPSGNPKTDRWLRERGKFVTVEVAALYLITAIYYGTLEIAQSPYLTDLSQPEIKRRQANTKDVVSRAWKSTAEWQQRLDANGLAKLKAADDHPLKAASVRFW